jgi:cellulose biosynthesis protein BcsQ
MVTFALYNLKGGVGKTASAINLASLSAKDGLKTLIWDLDPQGSSSFYLGVESQVKNESKKVLTNDLDLVKSIQATAYPNLFIIPSDISARQADVLLSEMKQSKKKLAALLASLKDDFDIIFIDCPPGISLLHDAVFYAVDTILIPNIPTTLAIRSYDIISDYFENNGLDVNKIRCFFSMVDHRKNLHHEIMNQFYKDKVFFKNYIPYLSDVEKMGIYQAPLDTFAPSSYALQCYQDLWKEIKKTSI